MKKFIFSFFFFLFFSVFVFSQTVYITPNGQRFHRATCQYVGKAATTVELWQAIGHGKTPCPKCKPPTKETKPSVKKKSSKPKLKPAAETGTKKSVSKEN